MGIGQGRVFEHDMGQGWGVHFKPLVGGSGRDISRQASDGEWAGMGV
jgi:hypothetical protein